MRVLLGGAGAKPCSVGPRCGDPRLNLWRFMLAKSAQDQIFTLVAAKSPCRGGGPAMRGGALRLDSAPLKARSAP
ncbi:hypothetical protein BG454_03240 [Roseinatronobacter bogoriensis subsp. barguzinensis]|uniref:Uncharacterized protein n=1 Tax=Roseinatronobacter bogoriensis subsp. barguzinensis TaxID=441209 RepID=A0A2K8KDX4_9RHOB|nr:hypothetical protein BG454_03240 [Rhodobaca barguzinensis]